MKNITNPLTITPVSIENLESLNTINITAIEDEMAGIDVFEGMPKSFKDEALRVSKEIKDILFPNDIMNSDFFDLMLKVQIARHSMRPGWHSRHLGTLWDKGYMYAKIKDKEAWLVRYSNVERST